jgi:hypothetical protein
VVQRSLTLTHTAAIEARLMRQLRAVQAALPERQLKLRATPTKTNRMKKSEAGKTPDQAELFHNRGDYLSYK